MHLEMQAASIPPACSKLWPRRSGGPSRGQRVETLSRVLGGLALAHGFPRAPQTEAQAHRSWRSRFTAPAGSASGSTLSPPCSPTWGQECQLRLPPPVPTAEPWWRSHPHTLAQRWTHAGQWAWLVASRPPCRPARCCLQHPPVCLRLCSQPVSQHLSAVCTPLGCTLLLIFPLVSPTPQSRTVLGT